MRLLPRLFLCVVLWSCAMAAWGQIDWHTPLAKRFGETFAVRDGVSFYERAIAVDGSTAVLGSPYYTSDYKGRALIVEKRDGVWTQTATLGPGEGHEYGRFGDAVAISGNTVAVSTEVGSYPSGAICVFVRSGSAWTQQARIVIPPGANDAALMRSFGQVIALQGDTLAVAAPAQRKVLVYRRAAGVWSFSALLISPVAYDTGFGYSLALDDSHLLIGSGSLSQTQSAFLFVESAGSWALEQRFVAPVATDTSFASSSAMKDGVVLIASRDGALLYERSGSAWSLSTTLVTDTVAPHVCTVALDGQDRAVMVPSGGNFANNGATFTRDSSGWIAHDWSTPALLPSGNTWALSLSAVAVNNGELLLLQQTRTGWTNEVYLLTAEFDTASGAYANPQLARLQYRSAQIGVACAVSSNTAVIGAPGDTDSHLARTGAVYLYSLTAGKWQANTKLTPGDVPDRAAFGQSAALSAQTLLVGAPESDGWRGSAYVYVQNKGAWSQQARLVASSRSMLARFGDQVAISGDTIAILAPGDDASHDQGCYIFTRSGPVWTETAHVTLGSSDAHGASVAIGGGSLWIGEPGASSGSGCVHEFRLAGTTWKKVRQLTSGGAKPSGFTQFGAHIATDGRQLIVSAARPATTDAITLTESYAFIYSREGSGWSAPAVLRGGYPKSPPPSIYYDTRSIEGPRSVSISGGHATLGLGQFVPGFDLSTGLPEQTHCFVKTSAGWRSAGRVIANSAAASSNAWLGCVLHDALVPKLAIYTQAPDIVVQEGRTPSFDWAHTELQGLRSAIGNLAIGLSVRRMFSILSTGASPLSGLRVRLKSATGGTARITQPAATTLAPGQHTTFAVTFIGQIEGELNWELEILSNDPDDSPLLYQVDAYGTALPEPPTAEVAEQQSFLNEPAIDDGELTGYGSGSEPLHYQWMLNGRPIPGATGTNYPFPKPKLPGGRYTLVVTNPYGRAESEPVHVGYTVPVTEERITVEVGAAFNLQAHLIGSNDGIQWWLDGNVIADDELHNGTTSTQYRVRVAALTDAGTYTATLGGTSSLEGEPIVAAIVHVTVVERPVQVDWKAMPQGASLTWHVGDQPRDGPFFTGDPRSLRTYADDLPPGVGWNEVTGTFTGSPQRPGDYITRLRAFDRTGQSVVLNLLIHVMPVIWPEDLGTWYGLLDRAPGVENDLGGYLTMKLTSNGIVSGAAILRGRRLPFVTRLVHDSGSGTALALVEILADVKLSFRSSSDEGLSVGFQPITGGEQPFALTHALPSSRTAPTGRFNVALINDERHPNKPRGDGFATTTLGRDGIRMVGRLADGSAFTGSTAALEPVSEPPGDPAYLNFPVFQVLYRSTGSVLGWLNIDTNADTIRSTDITLNKAAAPRTSGTYAGGFDLISMSTSGSRYTPFRPDKLVPDVTPVSITLDIELGGLGYSFTLSSLGTARFDPEARGTISVTVNATTGAVSGLMHHSMLSPFDGTTTIRRDIPFQALIVPGLFYSPGYCVVPPVKPPPGSNQPIGPVATELVQLWLMTN